MWRHKISFKEDTMKVRKTFRKNTPEQIQYAVRTGLAPQLWNIGDTIQVPLKGQIGTLELNTSCPATIIGFNHNSEVEGTNTLHLCFQALIDKGYLVCGEPNTFSHHNIATNKGGWDYSNIRRNILPQFIECLPQPWRDIITPCTKYTDNIGLSINLPNCIMPTHDKIWLLSEYEVFGKNIFSSTAEAQFQQQYEYFKKKKNRIQKNSGGTAVDWWLRSPDAPYSNSFCFIYTGGTAGSHSANYSLGLVPCIQIS